MKRLLFSVTLLLSVATLSAQSLKTIGNKLANQAEQFTFNRETVDTVFAVYWEDGAKTYETISAPTSPLDVILQTYKECRPGHIGTSSSADKVGSVVSVLKELRKGSIAFVNAFAWNYIKYAMCLDLTIDTQAEFEKVVKYFKLTQQEANVLYNSLELDKE